MVLCTWGTKTYNSKGENKMRKISKIRVFITRFFVIIATVLAIGVVTFNVGKVFVTQCRFALISNSISSAESARDAAELEAQNALVAATRRAYQGEADSYDKEIERLMQVRSDIMNSDDALIALTSKEGFEAIVFVPSLIAMIIIVVLWVKWYKNLESITDLEEMAALFIFVQLISFLAVLLDFLGKASSRSLERNKSRFFDLYEKREEKNCKKSRKQHRNNIYSFDTKKRIG